MRRRLDLAAALVHRPPVLFLDEPTTGLDPQGRNELWSVIEELVADGTTVLLTTQYLEEADRLADNIVVIDHGSVIAEGTAAELKDATRRDGRRGRASRDDDAADRGGRAARADRRCASSDGKLVRVNVRRRRRRPVDARGGARRSTARSSSRRRMVLREPTLDDVFLELTGHAAERAERRRSRDGRPTTRATMTADTHRRRHACRAERRGPRASATRSTMAWRNLLNIVRNPQLLVFATIQPVIFVLMFRYVFGGAIQGSLPPGQTYVELPDARRSSCRPSCSARSPPASASPRTCSKGLIERFRSLPMARSAVLAGRTLADLVRNFFVVILMCVVGFLVGWTIDTNVLGPARRDRDHRSRSRTRCRGCSRSSGSRVKDAETAQAASFPILAPLVFASSAFVPVATMPAGCRAAPRTSRCRSWSTPPAPSPSAARRRTTSLKAIVWIVGIVAVCAPIAVSRYRRAV